MGEDYLARTSSAYGGSAKRFSELVGTAISSDFETTEDQAALAAFVTAIPDYGEHDIVLDAGCGTGRVARLLADSGLSSVRGIDIAAGMIDEARAAHEDIPFEVAPLTTLPFGDVSVAVVVYWYSIITTPPEYLADIWAELDRVLTPTGRVLVSFQAGGGESELRTNAYGTETDLTLYRHDPAFVSSTLKSAGFAIDSLTRRPPQLEHETTDQAIITCHR